MGAPFAMLVAVILLSELRPVVMTRLEGNPVSISLAFVFAALASVFPTVLFGFVGGVSTLSAPIGYWGALVTLKDTMGSAYPPPGSEQRLHRADRLMEAKEYAQARREYQAVAAEAGGVERDQALVRIGAADFLDEKTPLAWKYLRDLAVGEPLAAAERLYYLAECARRRNDDAEMMSAVAQLAARYPQSAWRVMASPNW